MAWVTCFPLPQWGLVTLNRKLMGGKRNLIFLLHVGSSRFSARGLGREEDSGCLEFRALGQRLLSIWFLNTGRLWGPRHFTACPLAAAFQVRCPRRSRTHGTSPVLSQALAPRNTPSRAEHPAPTLATSAHSPSLTAALFPWAHRVTPGTELR